MEEEKEKQEKEAKEKQEIEKAKQEETRKEKRGGRGRQGTEQNFKQRSKWQRLALSRGKVGMFKINACYALSGHQVS